MTRALHFVRFDRFDQRFSNAVNIFGPPTFMHRNWDTRARREIMDGDVIVFAKGESDQQLSPYNGDDEYYEQELSNDQIAYMRKLADEERARWVRHRDCKLNDRR